MWPFERSGSGDVVRVGRLSVQHWAASAAGLVLKGEQRLPQESPDAAALSTALTTLMAGTSAKAATALVESAWMPVMLVDTGGALASRAEVQALARHRFDAAHGSAHGDNAARDLRVDHLAGDRFARVCGLASPVAQVLSEVALKSGSPWQRVVPACAWGWRQTTNGQFARQKNAWWLWPEQDRTLVVRVAAQQWIGLNAGADVAADGAAVERAVATESARSGVVDPTRPIVAAAWLPPERLPAASGRTTWMALAGSLAAEKDAA